MILDRVAAALRVCLERLFLLDIGWSISFLSHSTDYTVEFDLYVEFDFPVEIMHGVSFFVNRKKRFFFPPPDLEKDGPSSESHAR